MATITATTSTACPCCWQDAGMTWNISGDAYAYKFTDELRGWPSYVAVNPPRRFKAVSVFGSVIHHYANGTNADCSAAEYRTRVILSGGAVKDDTLTPATNPSQAYPGGTIEFQVDTVGGSPVGCANASSPIDFDIYGGMWGGLKQKNSPYYQLDPRLWQFQSGATPETVLKYVPVSCPASFDYWNGAVPGFCALPAGSMHLTGAPGSSVSLTLSDEDTEADAIERILARAWGSFVSGNFHAVWLARQNDFTIRFQAIRYKYTLTGQTYGAAVTVRMRIEKQAGANWIAYGTDEIGITVTHDLGGSNTLFYYDLAPPEVGTFRAVLDSIVLTPP